MSELRLRGQGSFAMLCAQLSGEGGEGWVLFRATGLVRNRRALGSVRSRHCQYELEKLSLHKEMGPSERPGQDAAEGARRFLTESSLICRSPYVSCVLNFSDITL